jgi:multidrug efflux pump subunit AcrA (membrane-fusion protein)
LRRRIASLVVLLLAATAAGCGAGSGSTVLSGRVDDEIVTVSAPSFTGGRPTTATVPALVRLGVASRLASVTVEVGDRVTAGEVVAIIDAREMEAQVEAARASAHLAAERPQVIDARLGDLAANRTTLEDNRRKIADAIAQLTSARRDLIGKLEQARATLAQLKALQAKLAKMPPPSLPPTVPPPPGAPNPRTLAANIAKLEAGIAKMEAGIAKMDAGLAKARSGLAKLGSADAKLADARNTLIGLRDVATVAEGISEVAVQLAQARLDLATLRSPVDGVVTAASKSGETVIALAPVVKIRPDAASQVIAYLTPEQHARLALGDKASVAIDSLRREHFSASVTFIGVRAQYPPSWMTTAETHMTRAFPVRVTLDSPDTRLPAGVPADVTFKSK